MLKKLGAWTLMLVGTAVFLQPVTANAQSRYDRGYYSYNNGGDRDRYYGDRDHERREWREREERREAAREREWRKREWREHERWERRNGYEGVYGNAYGNPYYRYPY